MKPLIWLGCMWLIKIWSWLIFGLDLEGFWIKMSCKLKVLRALCGPGQFFLLLIFCLNFSSLTFFLVREDLDKILKFQERIHISDTWIIIPSHDLSDLSSLNWRQIQLWMLLLIQLTKEKKTWCCKLCMPFSASVAIQFTFFLWYYQSNPCVAVQAKETIHQNFTNPSKKNKLLLSGCSSFLSVWIWLVLIIHF